MLWLSREIISILSLFLNYIHCTRWPWAVKYWKPSSDTWRFDICNRNISLPFLFKKGKVRLCSKWTLCQNHSEWVFYQSWDTRIYSKATSEIAKRRNNKSYRFEFWLMKRVGFMLFYGIKCYVLCINFSFFFLKKEQI